MWPQPRSSTVRQCSGFVRGLRISRSSSPQASVTGTSIRSVSDSIPARIAALAASKPGEVT